MSQGSVILPGSPLTGSAMVGDINALVAAIISQFSGNSAPTLGPGSSGALVAGQMWLNTSVTPNVLNIYDGTTWCPLANFDTSAHTFSPALSFRNILLANGGFEVWQRGAGNSSSFSISASTTAYTADRWYLSTGANEASTVTAAAPLTSTAQGAAAAKVTKNSGQTGTATMVFAMPLDTDEIVRMRGQKVTLSFLAKAGANWSPTSGTLTYELFTGTGAVGKRNATPYSSETVVINGSTNFSTSQQQAISISSSVVVPTGTTQAEVQFNWAPSGTAGADDSITIDDVQLEVGQMASPYEWVPLDIQLLQCKRHYWKTFIYGTAPVQNAGANTGEFQFVAGVASTGAEFGALRHPVSMRATPGTITTFNPQAANAQVRDQTHNVDCSAVGTNNSTTESLTITATGNASTTVGSVLGVHLTVDAGI